MAKMQESELPTSTQMDFKNIMLNSNKKKKEECVTEESTQFGSFD
jgi:hypothetical protein